MSITERAKYEVAKMRQAATLTANDGLLLMLMKIGSRPYVAWHSGVLMRALTFIEPFAKRIIPSSINGTYDEGCLFRICVDVYLAIVFFLLLFGYTVVVAITQETYSIPGVWVVSAILLFGLFRGYEILSFLALLHSQPSYKSSSLIRSLVNTIWHYAEMIIIFGVCYLACNYFAGDRFASASSPTSIVSHYVNAAYFSFISLTTIGYGDLSPQTGIGKLLVMLEGMTGLFLLVIVLQRAMSAGQEMSIEEVCGQLDERCATFISLMRGIQPSFERPHRVGTLQTEDISFCLSRLAALGILRFHINLGDGMYAYHWTELGKQIIARMPVV